MTYPTELYNRIQHLRKELDALVILGRDFTNSEIIEKSRELDSCISKFQAAIKNSN